MFVNYSCHLIIHTIPRARSQCDADDWEGNLLTRHGLELAPDGHRLRPKRPGKVRMDEIEGLHMATLMPGPKSSRLKQSMKDHMHSTGKFIS